MPLADGAQLGPYEVLARLGAGGMGEVYRARDTKLGREVALKILAPALAGDPQYMARFQREAQVLASLNHPHIATVHGLEESEGVRALSPRELFGIHILAQIAGRNDFPFEAAADGKRFLVNTVIGEESEIPLIVVQNRLAGVKR